MQRNSLEILCSSRATDGQPPSLAQVKGQVVRFTKQDILAVLTIEATPLIELSFNHMVACIATGSQAFEELCMNLLVYSFDIGFMKSGLLKEELTLAFLFCKYNIAPSSTTMEAYGDDVELHTWIMNGSLFNIDIMC